MRLQKQSKFLPHFMATLLAATMLVAPLPAQAAVGTCTVTNGADDVDTPPSGSLRACSELVGGSGYEDGINVRFSVGSVGLVAPVVFSSPDVSTVTLTGPVEIYAANNFASVNIDIETLDRMLMFFQGDVTLDGLQVSDAPFGAVYASTDSLTVSDSTFSRNTAASGSVFQDGGAIFSNSSVTVENSIFNDNQADWDGGAIYSLGALDISTSTFTDNASLTEDGGALWSDGDAFIDTSHFEGNTAEFDGGAALVGEDLIVVRSSFVSNSSGEDGGAILGGDDEDSQTNILLSTFYNNSSGEGGALYQADEEANVIFSTFVDNSADSSGSSIYTEDEDVNLFASIFANSTDLERSQINSDEDIADHGGNVLTHTLFLDEISADFYFYNDYSRPDIETVLGASYASLDLGELTELSNGTYAFIPESGSVAGDMVDPDDLELFMRIFDDYDSQLDFEVLLDYLRNESGDFADQSGEPFEGMVSGGSIDFFTQLQPVPYVGPVVTNDPETAQSGSTVTYTGSDLDEVTSATIAGQSAAIVSKTASALTLRVPAALTQGMHDVVLHYSTTESLTLQNGLVVQDLMKVWTQLQSDNTVKMYAKNIVGVGKIQFFHNSNEIAWVRATNALNPKLRQANGSSYLVRTRELVAGKNAFEIYQDGKRIWRAAYSN